MWEPIREPKMCARLCHACVLKLANTGQAHSRTFKSNMAHTTNVWTLNRMTKFTCLLLLLMVEGPKSVSCLSFDSITGLKALADNEDWLTGKVREHLVKEEDRLQNIQEQLKRVISWAASKDTMSKSEWDQYVTTMVEHPVNAFNLIKDWKELNNLISGSEEHPHIFADTESQGISVPGDLDYRGALAALIRLQRTYKIPTMDLARGIINNVTAIRGLSPHDCFEVGKMAMEVEHGMALSWLELFLQEGTPTPQEETETLRLIIDIYKRATDYERAWLTANKIRQKDPNNPTLIDEMDVFMRMIETQKTSGNLAQQKFYWKNQRDRGLENYEALCRGENLSNDIRFNKHLICVYRRGIIPYVQYKEEIHSFSPRISLFLDVISDNEADDLKKKAAPGLFRAQVGDPSKKIISEERVGKLNWLWDTDTAVLKLSQRVSDITGLSTVYKDSKSHSEAFQIVNYGMAGQYEPHYDYYEEKEFLQNLPNFLMGTGDRISTYMFYLSDVTSGGATVFPSIGVRVPPIKNAAAFWYNFDLAGESGDGRTLHAGCPVLLGQKWVGNKWIRQEGQHFRRKCALDRYAIDPIWYS